jgi:hypothetical protein
MKIEISYKESTTIKGNYNIRVLLFNDSFSAITIFRNCFIGPNVNSSSGKSAPLPESVEATFGALDEPLTLQPFTFYGRERNFEGLMDEEIKISAYYDRNGQREIFVSEVLNATQSLTGP